MSAGETSSPSRPQWHGHAGEACAQLHVDLDALGENWRTADRLSGTAACAAVVKGNAYGTGIERAVPALLHAGARTFFAATIGEARRVRTACGPDIPIYVLNGLLPGTAGAFIKCDLRPVLGTLEEVAEWREAGGGLAALHVDTGMNRFGLSLQDAQAVAAQGGLDLSLVMTHMACADEPGHAVNARQIATFEDVRLLFPGMPASLCNSASVAWLGIGGDYDLSRPGIALYGGEPINGHDNPFRPVVELVAPVLSVRDVAAGDIVGYGATWTAQRDTRIATIGLGYADGFHRVASAGDGESAYAVQIDGQRAPLAGRVNMDLLTVDVTDIADVSRGTPVTVIGGAIPLSETAQHFRTNVYEVLTSLGARYHRRYMEAS
ncbi:alanine racemase [Tepidamorphus sp. 3E244]|uniref:alanine racemase n=1 Tax=Tepidamorphus sp. 3E244 TaxID=3385498 RepID=UPI0038FC4BF3